MSDTKLNYIQIGDLTYNIGGTGGSGGSVGGYPVVTVEDNFNIEAEPNTFYNIKNNADSEISINFKDGFSVESQRKHIMFTGDVTPSNPDDPVVSLLEQFGGVLVDDTSVDGYEYRIDFDAGVLSSGLVTGILPVYFSNEIKSGGSVEYYAKQNPSLDVNLDFSARIDNINILNDGIDYLIMINVLGMMLPHIALEETNDKEEYNHKYVLMGFYGDWVEAIYTIEPYHLASNFYNGSGIDISLQYTFQIVPNIDIQASNIANEFVFNINSPANITFNNVIKWNNNNMPDLTREGVCTISIVNGVGCYTFVNN